MAKPIRATGKLKVPTRPPTKPPLKTPVKMPVKPPAKIAAVSQVKPSAKTSSDLVAIRTTAGKVKIPKEALKQATNTAIYDTLSLIGFTLAALRSQDTYALSKAETYVPGFILDLQKYGIPFPAQEFNEIRHHAIMGHWPQAYKALQIFSNAFGPAFRTAIERDNSVKAEMVTLANSFLSMIAVRDPSRWGQLESAAINKFKFLDNPELNSIWRVKESSGGQADEMRDLKDIVARVRGRVVGDTPLAQHTLTVVEKRDLLKRDPELNKKYNAAYNAARKKYWAALRNYILDHDDKPQPIGAARKEMESRGFYIHDLPVELDKLFIGSDGFYYTDLGLKVKNRPAAGAIFGGFNPDYDPNDDNSYIFRYKTEDGDWTLAYTENFGRESKTLKSDIVMSAIETVPDSRPKWLADLKGKNNARMMTALLTEISYMACSRIGSPSGYTKGHGRTFGLSTLQRQHCVITPSKVTLTYHGKDAKPQKHIFTEANVDERRIAAHLRELVKGKKPDADLFTYNTGARVTEQHVNAYMKAIGLGITSHKMRSIRGTRLLRDLLKKYKKTELTKMSPTQVDKMVKEEALEVGSLLGHVSGDKVTATTALKSYIDPKFMQTWFHDNGLRVPLWAKSMAKNID